ncbi:hypothetical protein AVEN_225253-1 [Araneus ventricosus]|uniref:Uncharacterized protein n=1 Tax=Araneus ventricosus TaxID=182803 RepID=A0A4Y2AKZ1_ARAVE|nr:hypothetical protein AVEN_225253-1 [Araneus ventricosus]
MKLKNYQVEPMEIMNLLALLLRTSQSALLDLQITLASIQYAEDAGSPSPILHHNLSLCHCRKEIKCLHTSVGPRCLVDKSRFQVRKLAGLNLNSPKDPPSRRPWCASICQGHTSSCGCEFREERPAQVSSS